MSPRPLRRPASPLRPLMGGWALIVLFLHSACVTDLPRGNLPPPAPRRFVTLTPSSDFEPIPLSDTELSEAFAQLVLEVPLRVAARPLAPRSGRLLRASWPSADARADTLESGYARLCERRGTPGDCFWLLGDGPHDTLLSDTDRFALGLSLALAPAVEAAVGTLRDLSSHAMTALLAGLSLYLLVLMAPEPLSKGLALAMTLFLWSYLGSELWDLIAATTHLWDEAKAATTFHQLRKASERYGQVLGPNTLRVLLLLATWKAGARGKEAMTGSGLPHFIDLTQFSRCRGQHA